MARAKKSVAALMRAQKTRVTANRRSKPAATMTATAAKSGALNLAPKTLFALRARVMPSILNAPTRVSEPRNVTARAVLGRVLTQTATAAPSGPTSSRAQTAWFAKMARVCPRPSLARTNAPPDRKRVTVPAATRRAAILTATVAPNGPP